MEQITLKVHSFIDIITNSSTEIYIQASEKTIQSIKTLVNSILAIGESKLTCDEIFTMELKSNKEEDDEYEDYERYYDVSVIVKTDLPSVDAKTAAKILGNLTGLFSIEASYDS